MFDRNFISAYITVWQTCSLHMYEYTLIECFFSSGQRILSLNDSYIPNFEPESLEVTPRHVSVGNKAGNHMNMCCILRTIAVKSVWAEMKISPFWTFGFLDPPLRALPGST